MFKRLAILLLLFLPFVATAQGDDEEYYIHYAEAKETIFSISRETGVKVSEIIDLNPGFTKTTKLSLGQPVRLPKSTQFPSSEVTPVAPDIIISHPIESDLYEVAVNFDTRRVVALLLPFYAKESGYTERGAPEDRKEIPSKAEPFMQFYEGALMALDSLKRAGDKIELYVFDVVSGEQAMRNQLQAVNDLSPDIIIGPVYENQAKILCEGLKDKHIPVIYPLSAKGNSVEESQNFVQVNISPASLAYEMREWLSERSGDAKVVYFLPGSERGELTTAVMREMESVPGSERFQWSEGETEEVAEALFQMLDSLGRNYIVVPTLKETELSKVLPVLLLCSERCDLDLIGLPDWQTFTTVDIEQFFKLNVTFFAYSYTDGSMAPMKSFDSQFRGYFGTEPSGLASKGYDTMLYFGHLSWLYGKNLLRRLNGLKGDGLFSTFEFEHFSDGEGFENRALFKVTYGKNYKLSIQKVEKPNGGTK